MTDAGLVSLFSLPTLLAPVLGATTLTLESVLKCRTFWALAVGAVALWLALPGSLRLGKVFGSVLGLVALGLLFADVPLLGDWGAQGVFWLLALVTLVAAVGTISSQSPVYSAIWFALSLLATAGLFFFQGSQFLGVATIVVYAGAIVVTFLFVIMLAQPEGHSSYDRVTWGPLPKVGSVLAAAMLVGLLTMGLGNLKTVADQESVALAATAVSTASPSDAITPEAAKTASKSVARDKNVLAKDHMAHLGGYLFSRHLVSIEVAGTLLLAALVGAVAICIQGKHKPSTLLSDGRLKGVSR